MNKRWMSLLLTICLLFTMAPAYAAAGVQTAGDIDGNSIVNAMDVQAFSDALAKGKNPAKSVADVTQDGVVGIDDLQALAQYVNGNSRTARILSENGFSGSVYAGIAARLEVSEHFMPFRVGSGYARVTNAALSYDSGNIPLSFETSGRALYCHFDTAELALSDEYTVYFTLFDRDGKEIVSAMPGQKMAVVASPALRQMTLTSSIDAQIVTPAMSTPFMRRYNYDAVQASHLGDFGYGWSHSFDIYVLEYTDGLTGIHMPSGQARWFKGVSAGIYAPLYGDTGTLTRDSDGKYRLKEEDGSLYGFYKSGKLQFMMNPGGENIYLHRNAEGQITQAESSFKRVSVHFKYTAGGRVKSVTDQYGRTTRYEYDPSGTLLTSVTAADGGTVHYAYMSGSGERTDNRLASIETASGVFTHFFYDDQGRLTGTSGTWGANPYRYVYDDATGDVRVTDAAGMEQTYRYDSDTGTVTMEIDGNPVIISNGNMITKLKTETDEKGRLVSINDMNGNALIITWDDASGKIASVTDPSGNTLKAKYDNKGNLISATYPDGSTVAAEYNTLGLMTGFTDANGNQTVYKYTSGGQAESITNAEGISTTVSYDKYGSISAIRDADKKTTSYKRDIIGRITSIAYPDGTKESFTYRVDGCMLSQTDASGNRIEYTYDLTGRLEKCTFADGTSLHYTYDARGSLLAVTRTNAAGQETAAETVAYDASGLVVSTASRAGDAGTFNVSVYGETWDRVGYGYSDGYGVNYEYDASGRMSRVFDEGGTIAEYEYNVNGQVTARRYGNGTYTLYERDANGNVTAIREYDAQGALRDETVYVYDSNGNCVNEITPFGGSTFSYDKADRLTGATYRNSSVEAFAYDKSGNIVSRTVDGERTDAKFSDMNRVTKAGSREYSWDTNGNLIRVADAGSVTELTWNLEGRLVGVSRDGEKVAYDYDPLGRLSSRATKDSTVFYEWDYVTGNLTAVRDENGNVVLKYVYGPEMKEILAVLWDTGRAYIRQDKNHSIVGATDTAGNYTDRQIYSAYGDLLYGARLCDFGYAGMLQDEITGFLYAGERWYDPGLGIFISPDKESIWDGMLKMPSDPRDTIERASIYLTDLVANGNMFNRYAYAGCNPLRYWDPDGRLARSISGGGPGLRVGGCVTHNGMVGNTTVSGNINIGKGGSTGTIDQKADMSSGSGISLAVSFGDLAGARVSADDHDEGITVGGGTTAGGGWPTGGGGFGGGGGGSGGGCCPTFIQIEADRRLSTELPIDVTGKPLSAKITVPVDGAYLRSDIPIFGVAGGEGFDHYTVEYASVSSPEEWILIESSTTPQNTTDVASADIWNMQGDIDIRGNLATWNTGLKNWEHLPWHPADEDIDLLGEYTIRLTVYGKDGTTAQDSIPVVVGDVAAQCVGGRVHSTDGLFEMQIEPLSLSYPFRVFSAKPVNITTGSDRIKSALYDVSPHNETFMQKVKICFDTDSADRTVILYNAESGQITELETCTTGTGVAAYIDQLPDQGVYFALATSDVPAGDHSTGIPSAVQDPVSETVYCSMSFDNGDCGSFESIDGPSGADIYCENGYLVLENRTFGGTFGASCIKGTLDASEYPVLTFDYCVLPGVKLDLYLQVNGRYYNVNFTDDPQGFRNMDVNIASAGCISGVVPDGRWHTASVRLDKTLALATKETVINGIYFRDLDVEGYMKLNTGSNPALARLLIDNFSITALPDGEDNEVLIDSFTAGDRNLLGGPTGVYNGDDDLCTMSVKEGCLQLIWDTGDNGGYAGYWSDLGGLPLEDVSCLKVEFAGSVPDKLRCGIRCGSREASAASSDYATPRDDGGYSVSIPLEALGFNGRDSADVVFFAMEGKGETGIGRISMLTGISSENSVSQGRADVFDDNRWISFSDGAGAISFGRNARGGDDAGCRVSYGGSIGKSYGGRVFSYAGWAQEMMPLDVRKYESLVLNICGENGGEAPNVYLDDGTTRKCVLAKEMDPVTVSDSVIRIPLSSFSSKGVDLSHITSVQLVFEWEEMSGTVYISDIAFE